MDRKRLITVEKNHVEEFLDKVQLNEIFKKLIFQLLFYLSNLHFLFILFIIS